MGPATTTALVVFVAWEAVEKLSLCYTAYSAVSAYNARKHPAPKKGPAPLAKEGDPYEPMCGEHEEPDPPYTPM